MTRRPPSPLPVLLTAPYPKVRAAAVAWLVRRLLQVNPGPYRRGQTREACLALRISRTSFSTIIRLAEVEAALDQPDRNHWLDPCHHARNAPLRAVARVAGPRAEREAAWRARLAAGAEPAPRPAPLSLPSSNGLRALRAALSHPSRRIRRAGARVVWEALEAPTFAKASKKLGVSPSGLYALTHDEALAGVLFDEG